MAESLAGKLLVATPDLGDPNFYRSVVFIVEHDDVEGVLGLVLNRPTEATVAEHLPRWHDVASDPAVVFVGGPVTPDVAIGVVAAPGQPPEGWTPALGAVGLADLSGSPDDLGGVERCRVFAGYSGWVAGQLEMELAIDSWFVVDADESDVFSDAPQDLWRTVLSRQPSRLSWLANYPPDPRLN
jgi:putative transcriptional regulator